jgi:hypothetical protein
VADFTLIDIGKLAEPAKVLLEKLAAGGWLLFEPHQIRRVAKAEVAARRIRTLGDIEIAADEDRVLKRLARQAQREQLNIEKIAAGAVTLVEPTATPGEIDDDWLALFFDRAKLVSDEEMQSLWSRLLAGEANSAGRFSRRTLQLVGSLDKRDAHLITALFRYQWTMTGMTPVIVIMGLNNDVFARNGIDFNALTNLDALGIVSFNPTTQFRVYLPSHTMRASYFGTLYDFEVPPASRAQLPVGVAMPTVHGLELATICGATAVDGYVEQCASEWVKFRVTLQRVDPKQ